MDQDWNPLGSMKDAVDFASKLQQHNTAQDIAAMRKMQEQNVKANSTPSNTRPTAYEEWKTKDELIGIIGMGAFVIFGLILLCVLGSLGFL